MIYRFLLGCLFIPGFLLQGYSQQASLGKKPNILLIVVDDLNDYVQHFGGHPQVVTPHIDQLARKGFYFPNAYCNVSKSGPSRISLMSGKSPSYTGVYNNDIVQPVFRDNFTEANKNELVYTIPEYLKDAAGYYTVGINKILFGWKNPLYDNDFDSLTLPVCEREKSWNNYIVVPPPDSTIEHDGVPTYEFAPLSNESEATLFEKVAADSAIAIINSYAQNPGQYCNRPLFLALGLFYPHKPLYVPEKYFSEDYLKDIYEEPFRIPYNEPRGHFPPNGVIMPPQPEILWSDFNQLPSIGKSVAVEFGNTHGEIFRYYNNLDSIPLISGDLSEEERRFIIEESKRANAVLAYLAAIRFMDRQVGRVIESLESHPGIMDNTVILLVSDHGYSLGEKKHWHKFGLWETDIRIPFLVVDPDRPGNKEIRQPVHLLDLFPTLCDIAGVEVPLMEDSTAYPDGISLLPFMDNPSKRIERPAITSIKRAAGEGNCFPHHSVRNLDYHYIRYATDGDVFTCDSTQSEAQEELYHIGQNRDIDPYEWHNLARDSAYRPMIEYLSQFLPDSVMEGMAAPSVHIEYLGEAACVYTQDDSIALRFRLLDAEGRETAIHDNAIISWSNNLTEEISDQPGYTVSLAGLPDSVYEKQEALYVHLYYKAGDSATYQAYDLLKVQINADSLPTSDFTLDQNDAGEILVTDYHRSGNFRRSVWDFGDGYSTDEALWTPAPYHYRNPGNKTVTNILYYGNESNPGCYTSVSRSLFLDSTDFLNGDCLAPQLLEVADVSPDKSMIVWDQPFASQSYTLRYQKLMSEPGDLWETRTIETPTALLEGLEENTEYLLQLKSQCDPALTSGSDSDWSYPLRFHTSLCQRPEAVSVQVQNENTAQVRWDTHIDTNLEATAVYYRAYNQLNPQFETSSSSSLLLDSLRPGTLYYLFLRNHCYQLPPESFYAGEQSPVYLFQTPGESPPTGMQEMEGDLKVLPNPASYFIQFFYESSRSEIRYMTIFDMYGRKVDEFSWQMESGPNSFFLSTGRFSDGIYIGKLKGFEGEEEVKFCISR